MLKKSYSNNYLRIYLWQGISLVLNFLSMFIVVPYLTSKPNLYGIYTVCISISIFLTYADFGFIGAGQKFAAEHFARGETEQEIQVIGFTCFILLCFLLIFSIFFFYLSFNPNFLIKSLNPGKQTSIASTLLLILALFTPITLLQRLAQMIFGIRLEDYIIQRANIVASIIKITSILFFFRKDKYDIVGYFFFTQLINLLTTSVTLAIAHHLYNYNLKMLAASIRFNKTVFLQTKNLAFTSLYLTITWIFYYELDPVVISKFIGANKVAIYAIGLTILSLFRSVFGILFSPFNARFNHFIAVNDINGLKRFYLHITTVLAPLVIIPILTFAIFAKPLILTWVGAGYFDSINIASFLILCNLFAFITYPTGILLITQERAKEIYIINTIIPVVYWGGIILTYTYLGLTSFALFKLIAFVISAIFYYIIMIDFINVSFKHSLREIFVPTILPIIFVVLVSLILRNYMPFEKSKHDLLLVAFTICAVVISSFCIQIFASQRIRDYLIKLLPNFSNR